MKIDVEKQKQDFISIFNSQILDQYPDASKLLDWMCSTDFFTAPAAAKYHSNFEGGLCYHSLLVFDCLYDLTNTEVFGPILKNYTKSELALVSLCHDICKINTYKKTTRNVKTASNNGTGPSVWIEVPYFTREEDFLFGHGEKSVFYIMKYIHNVKDDILQAVRYHMGGLDTPYVDSNSSGVFATNPLALALHLADMAATFMLEDKSEY